MDVWLTCDRLLGPTLRAPPFSLAPALTPLLAVGVSEPEPSGRVGSRFSSGLLQIIFGASCLASESFLLHPDFSVLSQPVAPAFSAKGVPTLAQVSGQM